LFKSQVPVVYARAGRVLIEEGIVDVPVTQSVGSRGGAVEHVSGVQAGDEVGKAVVGVGGWTGDQAIVLNAVRRRGGKVVGTDEGRILPPRGVILHAVVPTPYRQGVEIERITAPEHEGLAAVQCAIGKAQVRADIVQVVIYKILGQTSLR